MRSARYIIIWLVIVGSSNFYRYSPTHHASLVIQSEPNRSITFSVVGDIMCHAPQYNFARVTGDSFDFRPVFREISPYFGKSDFVMGNFETVISPEEELAGYPIFNSPEEFAAALGFAGFDLLFTANNHALDQGKEGVLETIRILRSHGIEPSGTFSSRSDSDSIRIYNVQDFDFCVLSYSYGVNGFELPPADSFLVNLIDLDRMRNDLIRAKFKNPDFIILYFHFGEEYSIVPSDYQNEVVDNAFIFGADVVVASHPHVVQPIEYRRINNNLKNSFVAYSLGNFLSNQRWRYSDAGPVLNFTVTKNLLNDSLYISDINYLPTWVFKGDTDTGREYLILPAEISFYENTPAFLSEKDLSNMRRSYLDMVKIMEPGFGKDLVRTINYNIEELRKISDSINSIENL